VQEFGVADVLVLLKEDMAVSESLEPRSLEYTPTWALASVAAFFVLISIAVERLINSLGHVRVHLASGLLISATEYLVFLPLRLPSFSCRRC